ncbi:leucine-rich repeat-containing protein 43 [Thomomys bottae]
MALSSSSDRSRRGSAGEPGTVSAAVREHLRQLCLSEFPCGTGSWNRSRFLPKPWRAWRELVPAEEEAGSAEEEPVEALLGLVRSPHSPWAHGAQLGYASAEDRFLRELAIRSPLRLRDSFFHSYFRSLRVVDKQVSLIDKDLLKFLKLEELVLGANQIKEVDASNLPPTLKVLELYGNLICTMACLCTHPPPRLQHLGLGHNKLLGPLESLFVTANYWPNLISLDLGFNDLTDLQGMVASLSSLQNLRLLVLQGNPLALVPYYRGLTVDSLARLSVLDDISVSPNEKHQFRGLSRSADLFAREAHFVVTIGNVKGVVDSSILDPEPGPEGPFITYNYYVTYDFVEDEESEENPYGGVLAQVRWGRGLPGAWLSGRADRGRGCQDGPAGGGADRGRDCQGRPTGGGADRGRGRLGAWLSGAGPTGRTGADGLAGQLRRSGRPGLRLPGIFMALRGGAGLGSAGRPPSPLHPLSPLPLQPASSSSSPLISQIVQPSSESPEPPAEESPKPPSSPSALPSEPSPEEEGLKEPSLEEEEGLKKHSREEEEGLKKHSRDEGGLKKHSRDEGGLKKHSRDEGGLKKHSREAAKGTSREEAKRFSREVAQPAAPVVPEEEAPAESMESGATEQGQSESSVLTVHSAALPQDTESAEELAKLRPRIDPRLCPSPGTVMFSTTPKPWMDVIPCGYEMQHTLRDLVPVKAFLLAGTTVTVVEEKILSWPLVTPPETPAPAKKDGKKKKDKKEKAPKKKEPPKELRQDPPVLQVLGRSMVALEPLLMGEPSVSTVCSFGVVRSLEVDRLTFTRDSKKTKKTKTAKKDKNKAAALTSDSSYRPQPLTVEVQVQLSQYRTAEEAFSTLVD